jgi:DNA-binding transcriptional LysR family regulator
MSNADWNDLRYLVSVARAGSAAAAARVLDVSYATVLRRIHALQQSTGALLFEGSSNPYVLTPAGRELYEVGLSIESALTESRSRIDGMKSELEGTVRFTTTDSFANILMPPILAGFRERYPQINVEMLVTNRLLNLDKREADVALRTSAHPPESWVGMRLWRVGFGLFASPNYLEEKAAKGEKGVRSLIELDWLQPEGEMAKAMPNQWLSSQIHPKRGIVTVDSYVSLMHLALEGLGATILPLHLAQKQPGLRLLRVAPQHTDVDIWALTHAHLRQSARVRAFMDHLAQGVRAARDQFEAPTVSAECLEHSLV